MSWGAIKRTAADKAFSDVVREAHDYICQRCGKDMRYKPRSCHLSHYFGRGNKGVRYAKENAFCLCSGCHRILGESSHDHAAFVRMILGDVGYDNLVLKAHTPMQERHNAQYIKEAKEHYREQEKIIKAKRNAGHVGPIDFVSFQ